MKLLFLGFSFCLILACSSNGPETRITSTTEVCDGVNAMVANEITGEYDIENSRLLASKIVAAAEADAEAIEKLGSGSANVELEGRLGTTLKGVVKTKAFVSTEFFEQDKAFAQSACWIEKILQQDLSESDQTFFEQARQNLAKNRVAYLDVLTGLKKK